MGVSLDTNLNAQTIKDIVAQFNATNAADGITASGTVSGDNMVITVRGANGKTSEVSLTLVPELDDADVSGVDISSPEELLKLLGEAGADSSLTRSVASSSVFCDLYQVLALLLEVAQTQREQAAKVRAQMHEATQATMMQQAANIRETASSTFALGIASAAVATVTTAVSAGFTIGSAVSAGKAVTKSGMADAEKEMSTAQRELSEIEGMKGPGTENENIPDGFDPKTSNACGAMGEKKQGLAAAQNDKKISKEALHERQKEYVQSCGKFLESADADIAKQKAHVADLEKGTGGIDDVEKARQKLTAMTKFRESVCKQNADGMKAYCGEKLQVARGRLMEASKLSETLGDARKAQGLRMSADLLNTTANISTKWFDTFIQKEKGESEATSRESDATLDQEHALTESAGELHEEAQELIDSIRKLIMEIIQAETDSVRSAIQA